MNHIARLAILTAATLAIAPAAALAQRNRELTRIDSTFSFEKGGAVEVSVVSGEIIITGWTRPEAKVYASIDRGWLDSQLNSHRIAIETRSDHGHSSGARIEIMVPIGSRVQAGSVSGSIRITGTDGEVDAGSVSGNVEVLGAADRISVHTVSGRVHAAKLRGRTRLSSTNATIEAEDAVGDLSAGSVSGRITLSGITSSHVSAETVSGSVTYIGSVDPSGSYEFSTHSGNVHLQIPDNAGAEVSLETFSGRISSSFPMTLQPGDISAMARRGKKMEFTIGRGGARFTATTFSGNINIDKGGRTDREEN